MKKFLVVLLALGLIVAFSAPAAATDVKFSGSYYVAGYYDNNHDLGKDANASPSDAYYAQRLRVVTVFQVAEGLSLNTRFDAMERVWGADRSTPTASGTPAAVAADSQNISFERAYVSFAVPVGTFYVGYQEGAVWGTKFGDGSTSVPRIKFVNKTGPWTFLLCTEKGYELDHASTTQADKDKDLYLAAFQYKWNGGDAGLLYEFINDATASGTASPDLGYKGKIHVLEPYFKATFGPVYLEGEFQYAFGKYKEYEASGTSDVDEDSMAAYLYGKINLGQFYVGGQYAFVSGDDPATEDKREGGLFSGDTLYNPCLILWNYPFMAWSPNLGNANSAPIATYKMANAVLYQVFAGMKPLEKLSIAASLSIANADEKGTSVDNSYGTEFDISGTYKIYDNLSYMVGFGYLWTGDYFKGTSASNEVENDYLLMNKLTLSF